MTLAQYIDAYSAPPAASAQRPYTVTRKERKDSSMRSSLVISLVSLAALAACGGGGGSNVGSDDNHIQTCQEQHDLAKLGKYPNGEISISCPDHGIGTAP